MKKKILGVLLAGASVISLAACDTKNDAAKVSYTDAEGNEIVVEVAKTQDSAKVAETLVAMVSATPDVTSIKTVKASAKADLDFDFSYVEYATEALTEKNKDLSFAIDATVSAAVEIAADTEKLQASTNAADIFAGVGLGFELEANGSIDAKEKVENETLNAQVSGAIKAFTSGTTVCVGGDLAAEANIGEKEYSFKLNDYINGNKKYDFSSMLSGLDLDNISEYLTQFGSDFAIDELIVGEESSQYLDALNETLAELKDNAAMQQFVENFGITIDNVEGSIVTFGIKISDEIIDNFVLASTTSELNEEGLAKVQAFLAQHKFNTISLVLSVDAKTCLPTNFKIDLTDFAKSLEDFFNQGEKEFDKGLKALTISADKVAFELNISYSDNFEAKSTEGYEELSMLELAKLSELFA